MNILHKDESGHNIPVAVCHLNHLFSTFLFVLSSSWNGLLCLLLFFSPFLLWNFRIIKTGEPSTTLLLEISLNYTHLEQIKFFLVICVSYSSQLPCFKCWRPKPTSALNVCPKVYFISPTFSSQITLQHVITRELKVFKTWQCHSSSSTDPMLNTAMTNYLYFLTKIKI